MVVLRRLQVSVKFVKSRDVLTITDLPIGELYALCIKFAY